MKVKARTRSAIFAAFNPSPVFEAIASLAEAFASGRDVFTVTDIDDPKTARRAPMRKQQRRKHGNGSMALRP